jgi:hypothetical protein
MFTESVSIYPNPQSTFETDDSERKCILKSSLNSNRPAGFDGYHLRKGPERDLRKKRRNKGGCGMS